jgi:hypothetical protein
VDLYCSNNQLSTLALTNKLDLRHLYISGNNLTTLDLSRNYNLWILYAIEMPSLTEICVWEMPFPPESILVNLNGSPSAYFTTECSL